VGGCKVNVREAEEEEEEEEEEVKESAGETYGAYWCYDRLKILRSLLSLSLKMLQSLLSLSLKMLRK
jgi:hypothetical protein